MRSCKKYFTILRYFERNCISFLFLFHRNVDSEDNFNDKLLEAEVSVEQRRQTIVEELMEVLYVIFFFFYQFYLSSHNCFPYSLQCRC